MSEAIVIVTRLKENQLEVLTSRRVGRTAATLPSAALQVGEHPCEAAMRALDQMLGSDACQTFRKLKVASPRHYFQASPELADDPLPVGCEWTSVATAGAALPPEDALVLAALA